MISLAPHQSSAVDWILGSLRSRHGVMLCDDVGLGKSWVAAAVGKSFQRDGESVELVVPAMLRDPWTKLLGAFSVDARLTTHEALRNRPSVPGDGTSIVIVDEAHRFRNPRTAMFDALARLTIGRKVLLVTATPVWNSMDDLAALLSIIAADDALRGEGVASIGRALAELDPDRLRVVLDAYVLRRDGEACGIGPSLARVAARIVRFGFGGRRRQIDAAISRLQFPLVAPSVHRPLLRRFLWHRLASSDAALSETLRRQRRFHERALGAAARGLRLTRRDYRGIFGDDDLPVQDLLFPEFWMERDASIAERSEEIGAEIRTLDALVRMVDGVAREKMTALLALLDEEPAILFTSSIATARALFASLRIAHRCGLMTSRERRVGTTRVAEAGTVLDAFREGRFDLLIATDCGAEGLDLQRAGRVIHYDLPWTSVRLRQRVGRVNRVGQARPEIESILFIPEGRTGSSLVRTLVRKGRLEAAVSAAAIAVANVHRSVDSHIPSALRRGRSAMPSFLGEGSPQLALFEHLARDGRLDLDLARRLTRRYRIGVERAIAEVAEGRIDDREIEAVRDLLRSEEPSSGDDPLARSI